MKHNLDQAETQACETFFKWAYEVPYQVKAEQVGNQVKFIIVRADDDFQNTYADEPKEHLQMSEIIEDCGGSQDYIEQMLMCLAPLPGVH